MHLFIANLIDGGGAVIYLTAAATIGKVSQLASPLLVHVSAVCMTPLPNL